MTCVYPLKVMMNIQIKQTFILQITEPLAAP
jgi:hypothetical protein